MRVQIAARTAISIGQTTIFGKFRAGGPGNQMQAGRRRFTTLDGLRGVAALLIVTRHAPVFFAPLSRYLHPSISGVAVPPNPFSETYLAVDFFFALSGFVLASAYTSRFLEGLSGREFLVKRIIRLYPLYIVAVLIATIPALLALSRKLITLSFFIKETIPALLFIPSPSFNGLSPLFPLNGPAWSLFFELMANACFGFLGKYIGKGTIYLAVGSSALLLVAAVLDHQLGFGAAGQGAMADGFQWRSFGAGCARVAYSFSAGVGVYWLWRRWPMRLSISPLLVCCALLLILTFEPPATWRAMFDLSVALVGFPVLLWVGASSTPRAGIEAYIFTSLGVCSYAIYIFQDPLYNLSVMLIGALQKHPVDAEPWYAGALFVVGVLIVSVAATKLLDAPLRAWLTVKFDHTEKHRPPVSPLSPKVT